MTAIPAPVPIPRDHCLVTTLGRDGCRCRTCCRELAGGIETAEQFEAAAEARRKSVLSTGWRERNETISEEGAA